MSAPNGEQTYVNGITFTNTTAPAGNTGEKRLESDGLRLFFDGVQLGSAGNVFNVFTTNIMTAGNNSNILFTSNLLLETSPSIGLGGGLQTDGSVLFFNGTELQSQSNLFSPGLSTNVIWTDNTLSGSVLIQSNLEVDGLLYANTSNITFTKNLDFAKADPVINYTSGKMFLTTDTGESSLTIKSSNQSNVYFEPLDSTNTDNSNRSQIHFLASGDSSGATNKHLLAQFYVSQNSTLSDTTGGGSKVILKGRKADVLANSDDGDDTQIDMITYSTSNSVSTGNVVAFGTPESNIRVGVGNLYPRYTFEVSNTSNMYFGVNTTSSQVEIGEAMNINFADYIDIRSTGDRVKIGSSTTTVGANSVAIGIDSAADGIRSVSIGNDAGKTGQGDDCIAIGANAALTSQDGGAIAIGSGAGRENQGFQALAIGGAAGRTNQGASSTAIGILAGYNYQGEDSIAIGPRSARDFQGDKCVAIGTSSGKSSQLDKSIAIGFEAGQLYQNTESVAIGYQSGEISQNLQCISIGYQSGQLYQNTESVAIGYQSGQSNQGSTSLSIGYQAGQSNQNTNSISIGLQAGQISQNTNSLSIGNQAGQSYQSSNAYAIGTFAGQISQNTQCTAIGFRAGQSYQDIGSTAIGDRAGTFNQGSQSIAIGQLAGNNSQSLNASAIGSSAGRFGQGAEATAIGFESGLTSQSLGATAIGTKAGNTSQGQLATAIGSGSGFTSQGVYAVAIGHQAADSLQGAHSVAIGRDSGKTSQGINAVAIGFRAGQESQGNTSIAIGYQTGQSNQGDKTIMINATGIDNTSSNTNATFISPIKPTTFSNLISYDAATGELGQSVKTFVIPHPNRPNNLLVHACLEGPEAGVYYRGKGCISGTDTKTVITLPDYVPSLITGDPTITITPIYSPGHSLLPMSVTEYDPITNSFSVHGTPGKFFWVFYGMRTAIDTEPLLENTIIHGNGPYLFAESTHANMNTPVIKNITK